MASQVENIKWVPGTSFIVDGFGFTNTRCKHYFLTHCHSDHTVGLIRTFNAGTIYCSPVSARILAHDWGLRPPVVQVLQLGQPLVIHGVTITAVDANHCPGAVMLLFQVPKANGAGETNILHTGDCRWQDELRSGSCLAYTRVDTLMLDTTYALPRYTFPPQQQAISMMVQVMRQELQEEPATLFVVGSYHIGKERVYLGAAEALGVKVYASAAKIRLLKLLDLPQQQVALLSDDAQSACVHVSAMGVAPEKLQGYVDAPESPWKRVVGFRPTGWSYQRSGKLQVRRHGDSVVIYGIPYSEHSSWSDLRACVASLRPKRIIPTVNAASKTEAAAIVERFADLMDHSNNRGRIDMFLVPACGAAAAAGQGAGDCSVQQDRADTISSGGSSNSGQWAGNTISRAADAAGVLTCQGNGGSQHVVAEHGSEEHVDLEAVDIAEQQRLLEQVERLQRLKRSVQLQQSAKKAGNKRSRPSTAAPFWRAAG